MSINLSMKPKLHFERFEFKYQMPFAVVDGLIPELLKHMDIDPYAAGLPDNAYTVRSLYYDSVGLDCYYQKIAGVRTRKKLRIRTYDDALHGSTPMFLEIKKKYDTVVVKDRIGIPYDECARIVLDEHRVTMRSDRDQAVLDEFIWIKTYNGMVPQNMVVYERKPFFSKLDSEFRVTIDYNLRTYLAQWIGDTAASIDVNPLFAVLEVKFNNIMPYWFHRIIQRYGLEQRPFSKYCNALEFCKPYLLQSTPLARHEPRLAQAGI